MQHFELFIKNDKAGLYKKLALFMIVIALAVFAIVFFYSDRHDVRINAALAISLVIVFYILKKLLPTGKKNKFEFESASFLIITIALALMKLWLPAFLFLGLLFLYRISQRKLAVSVSASAVIYPSFPKQEIAWNELNNLLLKDDLLTIDFKNNKIIQQLIQQKEPAVDEQEFNDFCKAQLQSTIAPV